MAGHKRHLQAVVAFDSTYEALECERVCKERSIPGRLIPTPVAIKADCGLAWAMPPEVRSALEKAAAGNFLPSGIYELEL
ncbi:MULTISPECIES: DUF3343 domain-containing protein [Atopobiaceae]|uniref:DUF3343 domain-containing protein n=1 Tax=Atopobiaceae TaxID=1643824 RepID=UPI00034E2CA4|nr:MULTISPECIES: DUF3343 domain-containing protein [Atopobiaceae]EPD78461.1 hypothetical protein HMPREF1527_00783 [Atopobium sp. oral taxon 199 str. F0494]